MDQVPHDQLRGLVRRLLRVEHGRLESLADNGRRPSRQDFGLHLFGRGRVTCASRAPFQLGCRNEPHRHSGQRHRLLPGAICAGPECIPARFIFGVLKGVLGEVALGTLPDQQVFRGVGRRIQQGVGDFTVSLALHDQPFGPGWKPFGHRLNPP